MNKPIRVLIADDHAIVRQGLRQILSDTPDLTVAGEAENGVQAVQMVRTGEWDVVLMDVSMPATASTPSRSSRRNSHASRC